MLPNLRFIPLFPLLILAWTLAPQPSLADQWEQLCPALPVDGVTDLVMRDSTVGFFSNAAGSIFRTTDGGSHWERVAHIEGDCVSLIRFADALYGFAASPFSGLWTEQTPFLYTTDGGAGWTEGEVDLADAACFIPLSRSAILKGNDTGIQKLDNFFGQWTTTFVMPTFMAGDVRMSTGSIHAMVLRGGTVIALGSHWRAKQYGVVTDSVSFVVRSSDEGSTWSTLWSGSLQSLRALAFADSLTGWAGGEHRSIYRTTDGGVHWTGTTGTDSSTTVVHELAALSGPVVVGVTGEGSFSEVPTAA